MRKGPNVYAYVVQNPWTAYDPLGLLSWSDAWDYTKAGVSGAAGGAFSYGKGLVKSPYTLGKTVVGGYQEMGGLIGDAVTGDLQADVSSMARNPGSTMQATGEVAVDTVKQVGASLKEAATNPEAMGDFVGQTVLTMGMAEVAVSSRVANAANPGGPSARTINQMAPNVADDALVNFGRNAADFAEQGGGGQVFAFEKGSIGNLTLKQTQTVIGDMADAGLPGGANVMRILDEPKSSFYTKPGDNIPEIIEYVAEKPVKVKENIDVTK